MEKEKLEKERLQKEQLEKEMVEKERLELERLEQERLNQARLERERLEKEKRENERLEQEKCLQEKREQERLEEEKREQAKLEQDNLEEAKVELQWVQLFYFCPIVSAYHVLILLSILCIRNMIGKEATACECTRRRLDCGGVECEEHQRSVRGSRRAFWASRSLRISNHYCCASGNAACTVPVHTDTVYSII
jgi:hypothetical protein